MKTYNFGSKEECIRWLDSLEEGAKVGDVYGDCVKLYNGDWETNIDDPRSEREVLDASELVDDLCWPVTMKEPELDDRHEKSLFDEEDDLRAWPPDEDEVDHDPWHPDDDWDPVEQEPFGVDDSIDWDPDDDWDD